MSASRQWMKCRRLVPRLKLKQQMKQALTFNYALFKPAQKITRVRVRGIQAGISCLVGTLFPSPIPILSDFASIDLKFALLYNGYVTSRLHFSCQTSLSPVLALTSTSFVTCSINPKLVIVNLGSIGKTLLLRMSQTINGIC